MLGMRNTTPTQPEQPRIHTSDVRESLLDHGVRDLNCPSCGKEGIRDGGPGLEIRSSYNDPIPLFVMICQDCGFVREFDDRVLKIQTR